MIRYIWNPQITFLSVQSFSKKKSSTIWVQQHKSDPFVKKSQMMNYRSRAAFKLIEIQHRYNIMKPNQNILDLGAAPGSWTQVAVDFTKSQYEDPSVLGVDLLEAKGIVGSKFIQGDFTEKRTRLEIQKFFKNKQVDTIICDAAQNFMGDKDCDHIGIAELNQATMMVSQNLLKVGGNLVMKSLQGTLEKDFFDSYKLFFKNFQRMKPTSSRSRSSEFYYVGRGYKLSPSYQIIQKIEQYIQKNKKIPEQLLSEIKVDIKSLEKQLNINYQYAQIQEDQKLQDQLKLIADLLNIKLSQDNPPDQEKFIEQFEKLDSKLSFNKKIPQSVEELEEVFEKINDKNKNNELLQSDDEYNDQQDSEDGNFSDSDLESTKKLYNEILQQKDLEDELHFEEIEKYEQENYEFEQEKFKNMTEEEFKSNDFNLESLYENLGFNRNQMRQDMEKMGYDFDSIDPEKIQLEKETEQELDRIEKSVDRKIKKMRVRQNDQKFKQD